jgi:hypothetical protein
MRPEHLCTDPRRVYTIIKIVFFIVLTPSEPHRPGAVLELIYVHNTQTHTHTHTHRQSERERERERAGERESESERETHSRVQPHLGVEKHTQHENQKSTEIHANRHLNRAHISVSQPVRGRKLSLSHSLSLLSFSLTTLILSPYSLSLILPPHSLSLSLSLSSL